MSSATSSSRSTTLRSPFLLLLLAKISANDEAITTLKPKSASAHTACSREDPQPKFFPVTRMLAPRYRGSSSTKGAFASGDRRQSKKRNSPNPVRSIRFRNCLGIIWSVSTFTRSSGATSPWCTRNGFMIEMSFVAVNRARLLKLPLADIREVPRDRRRGRHHRAHQVCPATAPLPALEIPIAGGGAALARLQDIGIHSQAHGTARFAPLKACRPKNLVQSFPLGGVLYGL